MAAQGVRPFFIPLLVLILALALRHFAVEPSNIGHACDPNPWSGWCAGRTALIMGFRFQEIGWAALVAGVVATLMRRVWLGQLALSLGLAGLVLYSYDPAVIGALLGVLVIFRPRRDRPGPAGASSTPDSASSGVR